MTTAKKTRVAVIGVGDFGRNHVRVYKELDNAHLAGIVDANPERVSFLKEALPTIPCLRVGTEETAEALKEIAPGGFDIQLYQPKYRK